jgi:uncharacterized RDD family membrane protein YckC
MSLKIKTIYIAPKFKRFLAFLLDYIPIWFLTFYLFVNFTSYSVLLDDYFQIYIEAAENGKAVEMDDLNPVFLNYTQLINVVTMIILGLYSFVMESGAKRGTFAKSLLKIGVGDSLGNPIAGDVAFKRNVLKIITLSLFPFLAVWVLFDRKNRGLHDVISRTLVVSLKDYSQNNGQI